MTATDYLLTLVVFIVGHTISVIVGFWSRAYKNRFEHDLSIFQLLWTFTVFIFVLQYLWSIFPSRHVLQENFAVFFLFLAQPILMLLSAHLIVTNTIEKETDFYEDLDRNYILFTITNCLVIAVSGAQAYMEDRLLHGNPIILGFENLFRVIGIFLLFSTIYVQNGVYRLAIWFITTIQLLIFVLIFFPNI